MSRPAISMKWVEFDDGASYGVDLTVSGLRSQAQAEAAMAHMQKLFCGDPINVEFACAPAQAEPISDERIAELWDQQYRYHGREPCRMSHLEFARAILVEAGIKEKP